MSQRDDTDAFLTQVLDRLPLVEVVAGVVSLRRVGRSFRGPCPFHNGTNPNFDVSPSRHLAHCFTCGWGGDIVRFIKEHPAFAVRSFPEALKYLSERTGVTLPPMRGVDAEAESRAAASRQADNDALTYAYKFFRAARGAEKFTQAVTEAHAMAGMSLELTERVGAGYQPPGGQAFVTAVSRHGLAANMWEAFRRLGLLSFDGEAGTPEASDSVRDGLAPGLVFPVVGAPDWEGTDAAIGPYERLFGFVRWDADGRLFPLTQSSGALHVPRGILRMRRAAEGVRQLGLFSDANAWRATGNGWTGDAAVPTTAWETPAAIQRMRQITRMRPTIGLLTGEGSSIFWLNPDRLPLVEAVVVPEGPLAAAVHPCEAAILADPGLDLSDPIRAVADDRLRLVLEGWWRERAA